MQTQRETTSIQTKQRTRCMSTTRKLPTQTEQNGQTEDNKKKVRHNKTRQQGQKTKGEDVKDKSKGPNNTEAKRQVDKHKTGTRHRPTRRAQKPVAKQREKLQQGQTGKEQSRQDKKAVRKGKTPKLKGKSNPPIRHHPHAPHPHHFLPPPLQLSKRTTPWSKLKKGRCGTKQAVQRKRRRQGKQHE